MTIRNIACLLLFVSISVVSCFAQNNEYKKSVSILGDSYSTYEGYLKPDTNEVWYFKDHRIKDNDVACVEQTWWHQLIERNGWKLCQNNSYSGSTISNTGYRNEDYTARAFTNRMDNLGNPDIILIFGATNDSWVPAPIGEYKWNNWTHEDCYAYRPALARMLDYMTKRYLNVEIYFILNSELSDAINESTYTICEKYLVPVIALHDIEKKAGHPSILGMKAIADQVEDFIDQFNTK